MLCGKRLLPCTPESHRSDNLLQGTAHEPECSHPGSAGTFPLQTSHEPSGERCCPEPANYKACRRLQQRRHRQPSFSSSSSWLLLLLRHPPLHPRPRPRPLRPEPLAPSRPLLQHLRLASSFSSSLLHMQHPPPQLLLPSPLRLVPRLRRLRQPHPPLLALPSSSCSSSSFSCRRHQPLRPPPPPPLPRCPRRASCLPTAVQGSSHGTRRPTG
mmetsp:Transcript_9200/g.14624  ORF Transcript_9200/g.14624 Transcript_9200/m.14624 type:complete len:213 (-) Transcript_9200:107-745(-)